MRIPRILCICWHSVEPDTIEPASLHGWNPTVSLFRNQIRFLVDHYTPITIRQFLKLSEDPSQLRAYEKPPVLLTLDDGFKNVIDQALPVLEEFGAPALFFVIGEVVNNPQFIPWYVEAIHLLRKTPRTTAVYGDSGVDLQSRKGRSRLINLFVAEFKRCRTDDECDKLLNSLAALLEVKRPKAGDLDDDLHFVGREDLAKLGSSSLLTVGSHAMTHRYLENLSQNEQLRELRQSHKLLSEVCPSYFPVFAYPGGVFNTDTIAIAEDTYKCAFALYAGSSYRNIHIYPRIVVGENTVAELAYTVSARRLKFALPVKRLLQTARIWDTD
jgi:peptidoglycan/xylan/chitin deacetylase (PgdA/CDA1 family)